MPIRKALKIALFFAVARGVAQGEEPKLVAEEGLLRTRGDNLRDAESPAIGSDSLDGSVLGKQTGAGATMTRTATAAGTAHVAAPLRHFSPSFSASTLRVAAARGSASAPEPNFRLAQRASFGPSLGPRTQKLSATAQQLDEPKVSGAQIGQARIGLVGLAVMGQNLALNIAEKGFPISVFNRSPEKTDVCVARANKEGLGDKLMGYKSMADFVQSLQKPRSVIILVKAGAPVDATIDDLLKHLEAGDTIIDGGNEWYQNTERRAALAAERGLMYVGMGVSGGEEGARNGPSMMPGGNKQAFSNIADLLGKVSAQVEGEGGGSCVTYVGEGGSGNFVKMVHNGIEYGDMQLISEAYDILKTAGGLSNEELAAVFTEWNGGELESFLIKITADIMGKKDDEANDGSYLVDKILDKTGMKGTGKWTVQEAADLSVAAPTIEASLDSRFLSGIKDERVAAADLFESLGAKQPLKVETVSHDAASKKALVDDVRSALYASKVISYAQGMNIIRAKSEQQGWKINLGEMSRIWKGGCIIRAIFLDRIKSAYDRNPELPNLLMDDRFAKELADRQAAWRRVVAVGVMNGVALPGMSASLAYFDTYRRKHVPANLVQAQRDYFGSHTYERNDGKEGSFHTIWSDANSADSITTSGYKK